MFVESEEEKEWWKEAAGEKQPNNNDETTKKKRKEKKRAHTGKEKAKNLRARSLHGIHSSTLSFHYNKYRNMSLVSSATSKREASSDRKLLTLKS
jgi:hypothetical protein